MDEILHQIETMVEAAVHSHVQGVSLGFLGGAKWISSIHSMSTRLAPKRTAGPTWPDSPAAGRWPELHLAENRGWVGGEGAP